MGASEVVVQGTLREDGTLVLDEKPGLPPGRVRVTVTGQPSPANPSPAAFWAMLERIWEGQKARGFVPRSAEEVEAERRGLRDETEEEIRTAERIHQECEEARRRARSSPESEE